MPDKITLRYLKRAYFSTSAIAQRRVRADASKVKLERFQCFASWSVELGGRMMPRYFFHVKDGETSLDHEGVFFASAAEARAQALEMMGEILRDEGRNHWTGESWRMHVMDEDDETVCRLTFDSDCRLTGKTEPFLAPPAALPLV